MADPKNPEESSLEEVVLEAPVVVRVELGSVSLTAREVAGMQPGDVIETGKALGEPVVLRVAGRAVARGDLVEVEGEIGVRIREILEHTP
jgi:flagellar motor switch/type III secretory pathway protein FliN